MIRLQEMSNQCQEKHQVLNMQECEHNATHNTLGKINESFHMIVIDLRTFHSVKLSLKSTKFPN